MSQLTRGKHHQRFNSLNRTPNKENKSPLRNQVVHNRKKSARECSNFLRTQKEYPKIAASLNPTSGVLEHQSRVLGSLSLVQSLSSAYTSRQKRVFLTKKPGFESAKTLIFDLDETLVHCSYGDTSNSNVSLSVRLSDGSISMLGIKIRPFVKECLLEANKHFEVIVFTASERSHADPILNYLDPTHKLIHHRLYREHCIKVHGVFVKDLRILSGRRFKDMVIVDNTVHSFGYQLDNGVPIVSWYGDTNDRELLHLTEYFPQIKNAEDVRDTIRNTFNLREFFHDFLP